MKPGPGDLDPRDQVGEAGRAATRRSARSRGLAPASLARIMAGVGGEVAVAGVAGALHLRVRRAASRGRGRRHPRAAPGRREKGLDLLLHGVLSLWRVLRPGHREGGANDLPSGRRRGRRSGSRESGKGYRNPRRQSISWGSTSRDQRAPAGTLSDRSPAHPGGEKALQIGAALGTAPGAGRDSARRAAPWGPGPGPIVDQARQADLPGQGRGPRRADRWRPGPGAPRRATGPGGRRAAAGGAALRQGHLGESRHSPPAAGTASRGWSG